MVGSAEVALVLSVLLGIVGALFSVIGKGALADLKALQLGHATLSTKVAVLEASKVAETVAEHTARLQAIELGLGEIKGDLHYVKRWVEQQNGKG